MKQGSHDLTETLSVRLDQLMEETKRVDQNAMNQWSHDTN